MLGGNTALMVTGAPLAPAADELDEPPDVQPATTTATARAAKGTAARMGLLFIEASPPGEN